MVLAPFAGFPAGSRVCRADYLSKGRREPTAEDRRGGVMCLLRLLGVKFPISNGFFSFLRFPTLQPARTDEKSQTHSERSSETLNSRPSEAAFGGDRREATEARRGETRRQKIEKT